MKNTENEYNEDRITGSLITDNDNTRSQPDIILPDEKPTKILPIIDKDIKENKEDKKEIPAEDNLNAGINEAGEMDNSGAAGE